MPYILTLEDRGIYCAFSGSFANDDLINAKDTLINSQKNV